MSDKQAYEVRAAVIVEVPVTVMAADEDDAEEIAFDLFNDPGFAREHLVQVLRSHSDDYLASQIAASEWDPHMEPSGSAPTFPDELIAPVLDAARERREAMDARKREFHEWCRHLGIV